jgi:hypothetical protein
VIEYGKAMRAAQVIGYVLLLLAGACGDDEDSGGSPDASNGSGGSQAMDSSTGLADDTAGKACTSNAECPGGTCATQIAAAMIGQMAAAPGGYCTATCLNSDQCGAGALCTALIPDVVEGTCLGTCTAPSDCRDEYICTGGATFGNVVIPDTCRPRPDTDQLGDDVAGKACEAAEDCEGGQCLTMRPLVGELPGGYCSGACLEDAHCGAGGVCMPSILGGAGSCYEACAADGDCTREGYRCRPLGGDLRGCTVAADPLPDNTTGKACASDADCGGAEGSCASEVPQAGLPGSIGFTDPAPGGYCTQACLEDIDCGAGGACAGLVGACFARCTDAAGGTGCREGYVCEDRAIMPIGQDAGEPDPLLICAPAPTDEDAGL